MRDDVPESPPRSAAGAPSNGVPLDPIEFLRAYPPFDRLDEQRLATLARELEILFVPRGEVVLARSGPANEHLYVVRKGAVRLERDGHQIELVEEGEPFGFPSLIAGTKPHAEVVSDEECLLYRIPKSTFDRLMAVPGFASFFLEGLHSRLRKAANAETPVMSSDLASPARILVDRPPVTIHPDATVAEAARTMSSQGVSSVLVDGHPPAILTDRDLRKRVLARGLPSDTPAARVWTRPLRTLMADASLYEMLVFMLERRVHHVPLVDQGDIIGVVTDTDLLRHHLKSPFHLLRSIERSEGTEALVDYGSRLAGLVESMVMSRLDAGQIGRVVSTLNDAVIVRVVREAEEQLGPPPCRYAFMVHGSEGRREQTLLTDQDNALVFADGTPDASDYFKALGERVVEGLVRASFPRCIGGYMASRWCYPLEQWSRLFRGWIDEPEPEALLGAANFFDFRKVYGQLSLDPLEGIVRGAGDNQIFLAHLARAGLRFKPPLGLFRTLKEDEGGINLKKGGIIPIVSMARVHGLEAGSSMRSTVDRLGAASDAGGLSSEGATELAEAFRYLHRLRLENQLASHRGGRPVTNSVPLDQLSSGERRHLKEIFGLVRSMQESMAQRFNVDHLG
jgi:CBS domain-containing protein